MEGWVVAEGSAGDRFGTDPAAGREAEAPSARRSRLRPGGDCRSSSRSGSRPRFDARNDRRRSPSPLHLGFVLAPAPRLDSPAGYRRGCGSSPPLRRSVAKGTATPGRRRRCRRRSLPRRGVSSASGDARDGTERIAGAGGANSFVEAGGASPTAVHRQRGVARAVWSLCRAGDDRVPCSLQEC